MWIATECSPIQLGLWYHTVEVLITLNNNTSSIVCCSPQVPTDPSVHSIRDVMEFPSISRSCGRLGKNRFPVAGTDRCFFAYCFGVLVAVVSAIWFGQCLGFCGPVGWCWLHTPTAVGLPVPKTFSTLHQSGTLCLSCKPKGPDTILQLYMPQMTFYRSI